MTDDIAKLVERIEAANIVQLAANAFNVSVDDVLGRKRTRSYCFRPFGGHAFNLGNAF